MNLRDRGSPLPLSQRERLGGAHLHGVVVPRWVDGVANPNPSPWAARLLKNARAATPPVWHMRWGKSSARCSTRLEHLDTARTECPPAFSPRRWPSA